MRIAELTRTATAQQLGGWQGVKTTSVGNGWYKINAPIAAKNIIFNNGIFYLAPRLGLLKGKSSKILHFAFVLLKPYKKLAVV